MFTREVTVLFTLTSYLFKVRSVPFIMSRNTAALSHRKPASAGMSRDTWPCLGTRQKGTVFVSILNLHAFASQVVCLRFPIKRLRVQERRLYVVFC
jgi:hypothetical protein